MRTEIIKDSHQLKRELILSYLATASVKRILYGSMFALNRESCFKLACYQVSEWVFDTDQC